LQRLLQRVFRAVGVRSFLQTISCVMYTGRGKVNPFEAWSCL
jgi:hypothetical protein